MACTRDFFKQVIAIPQPPLNINLFLLHGFVVFRVVQPLQPSGPPLPWLFPIALGLMQLLPVTFQGIFGVAGSLTSTPRSLGQWQANGNGNTIFHVQLPRDTHYSHVRPPYFIVPP